MFVESLRLKSSCFLLSQDKTFIVTYTGRDVSVYPVLVLLVLIPHKHSQDGDEGSEVEECGSSREPKLLQQGVMQSTVMQCIQCNVIQCNVTCNVLSLLTTISQLSWSLLRGSARQR